MSNDNNTVLVTGAAGFVGASLVTRLIKDGGCRVVGIDSLNSYYDVRLKLYRLSEIDKMDGDWTLIKGNIADKEFVKGIFDEFKPSIVVNLAAQAGVRYSITNPYAYIESNINGFFNILEACREHRRELKHLVYASSSSVYGNNAKTPYSTDDRADNPVSLYAATKKSDELLAYAYSSLYGIPTTGLRFFTVYGPAGRPDMAYFSFSERLVKGEKIQLFNNGRLSRDFTYIDDIVEGVTRVMAKAPQDEVPHKLYNIGGSRPVDLLTFVSTLHRSLIKASLLPKYHRLDDYVELVPMQQGDVLTTCADTEALESDFGFTPKITLEDGLDRFSSWYKHYLPNV